MPTATNPPRTAATRCPGCLTTSGAAAPHCRSCGIWLAGPQAAELRWIDAELTRVDVARTWLISRRAALLDELASLARQPGPAPAPRLPSPPVPATVAHATPEPARMPAGFAAWPPRHRPEVSGRTGARLLLAAGAALVAIAATIFTVAGWSRIGPLGRCAILLAATAFVLSAARPLIRRELRATAEAVGAVGLALTLADAFLIQRFTGLEAGLLPVAAFCAAMAAAWAAYGAGTGLRGPRLAALALAQLAAPLALAGVVRLVAGRDAPLAGPVALGLITAGAVDALYAGRRPARPRTRPRAAGSTSTQPDGARPARREAVAILAVAIAAVATWTLGVLAAAAGLAVATIRRAAWPAVSPGAAGWLGLAFAAAAIVGAVMPDRRACLRPLARPAAVVSGALASLGFSVPAATILPARWAVAVTGACGFCVGVVALVPWRSAGPSAARRLDLAAGSAATLAIAAIIAAPAGLAALIPPHPLLPVWSGDGTGSQGPAGQLSPVQVPAATVLLALCAAGCLIARFWLGAIPARFRALSSAVAIVSGALAAGSLPAAAGLTGWLALVVLTAAAASLLIAGTRLCDRLLANVAVASGGALAMVAALWSLATPATTLAGLAALGLAFGVAAVRARHVSLAAISTAGAFAATVALAWAAPLAAGWPARSAALAGFLAAAAAIAAATSLRRVLPVHSVVLDLGAGPAALLSAAVTIGQRDVFTLLAVATAVIASGTAWLRTGPRRVAAAAVAAVAALAALAASGRSLVFALRVPARILTHPWHGVVAPPHHGLALAVVVLGVCLAALVTAAGALHGSGRASLDAAAVALPLIAAPAGVASLNGGPGYLAVIGVLLVLTLLLTAWAAHGESLAPAGAALASAALTIAWALAAPLPTLLVLGCFASCFWLCAVRARLGVVRIAAGCLTVFTVAAFAECLAFATGLAGWQAGFAALTAGAAAQAAAALLARRTVSAAGSAREFVRNAPATSADVSVEIEITGCLVTACGARQCLGQPWTASAAIAFAGLICLATAARADRRKAAWAGLALCYAAWCIGLTAGGVTLLEPYTCPAGVLGLAAGWLASRREPRPHSWLAYGPGLAVLLLPSLAVAWDETGWIRPTLLGLAGVIIAIGGARTRTQAPLLTGAVVALLVAGRELAPDVMHLVRLLPGWVPVAIGGAALLWAGATFEARLRDIRAVRRSLASLG